MLTIDFPVELFRSLGSHQRAPSCHIYCHINIKIYNNNNNYYYDYTTGLGIGNDHTITLHGSYNITYIGTCP